MDVRCAHCGTEYEFDEDKVPAGGVTVKCTDCGHIFKVAKAVAAPETPAALSDSSPRAEKWMVRQTSGNLFEFKELTTLQKWIVERKVSRGDEISRTGDNWKRLGDIAELASFFQVVDAAVAAERMNSSPGMGIPVPQDRDVPQTQTLPNVPEPAAPPTREPSPVPAGPAGPAPATPAAAPPADLSPPGAGPSGGLRTRDAVPAVGPAELGRAALERGVDDRAFFRSEAGMDQLEDDDPVAQWQRSKKRRLMVVMGLVVIVVAAGVIYLLQKPMFDSLLGKGGDVATQDPHQGWMKGAETALANDRTEDLDKAVAALEPITGGPMVEAKENAAAVAMVARLHVAKAGILLEGERLALKTADKEAPAAPEGKNGDKKEGEKALPKKPDPDPAKLRSKAEEHLNQAYRLAIAARTGDPKHAQVSLALASYQAERGAFPEMTVELQAAQRNGTSEAEKALTQKEAKRIAALADARIALQGGELTAIASARDRLEKLLTQPETANDRRLLYAHLALAIEALLGTPESKPEDLPQAEAKIAAWAKGSPTDLRGPLLSKRLKSKAPASQATPEKPGKEDPKGQDPKKDPKAGEKKSAGPATAKSWSKRGWAALNREKYGRSISAFEKAIEMQPGMADAHLGYAEALRFSGKGQRAISSYEMYLKLSPGGPDATMAKRAIQELKR
jgi:predicted Zn finger-like uncharacterized protein